MSPMVQIDMLIFFLLMINSSLKLPKNPSSACLAVEYGAKCGFGTLPAMSSLIINLNEFEHIHTHAEIHVFVERNRLTI